MSSIVTGSAGGPPTGRPQPEYPTLLPGALTEESYADGPPRRTGRDWFVDVVAFLLAVIAGLLFLLPDDGQPWPAAPVVTADIVLGVVASLALWGRRRWPVGVGIALAVITCFSNMAGMAGLIALFSVAVHRRFPVAAAVGSLFILNIPIFLLLRPVGQPYWFLVPVLVLLTVAVFGWGVFVRARRQLVLSLADRARRAESEQQLRIEQARQLERTRIAREMHDVLAHRISLLSLHAGALEFRPDAPAEEVAKAAAVIRSSAHQALQDLREVIGVLREDEDEDAPPRPQPTLGDLPALVEESRAAGMHVQLDADVSDAASVPASVGRTVYRIVQEGLTNARKHAHGTEVRVRVAGEAGAGLTVEVRNRLPVGAAAAPIPGAGTGIVGLTERAHLAGGRLEHRRTDGDFTLSAWLPWPS